MDAKITGFTPLMDKVLEYYKGEGLMQGLLYAAVFGRIWRYGQQFKKRCTASQSTIASDLGVGRTVVNRACQRMVKDGLLRVVSDVAGFPVEYIAVMDINLEIALDTTPLPTCSTVEQVEKEDSAPCSTVEHPLFNSKTPPVQQLNTKKVLKEEESNIAPKNGAGAQSSKSKNKPLSEKALDLESGGLDFLPSSVRPLAEAFIEVAGDALLPTKAERGKWRKFTNEWVSFGFTPELIREAVKSMRSGRIVLTIAGPQSITKVARSLQAQKQTTPGAKVWHAGDPLE